MLMSLANDKTIIIRLADHPEAYVAFSISDPFTEETFIERAKNAFSTLKNGIEHGRSSTLQS